MAFVRMILPAWIAGLYAGLLLLLLIFFLNPGLPLNFLSVFPLLPLALAVSIPLAIGWPLGYRFVRVFARRRLKVRRMGFKYLIGFATADLLLVVAIYWINAEARRNLIPPEMLLRLRTGAVLLSLVTLGVGTVAIVPRLRKAAGIRLLAVFAAAALPAVLGTMRSGYRPPPPSPYTAELARPAPDAPRLLVLGLTGASLDQVLPLVAQGKLPEVGRLLNRGAHGRLAPLRPSETAVAWQSLLTGKLPYRHGITGELRYRAPGGWGDIRVAPVGWGFPWLAGWCGLQARPVRESDSEALTVWQILSRLGFSTLRVDRPARPPAPIQDLPDARIERFLEAEIPVPEGTEELVEVLRGALAGDQAVGAAALSAWRAGEARAVMAIFPGLDRVSHAYLRYAFPGGFGDVPAEELEKYGPVLERYYRYLDDWIGRFLATDDQPLVLILSPVGDEPLPLAERIVLRLAGRRFESGHHHGSENGLILAAGPGIGHGRPLGKPSLLDVAPTLLYYYRLAVGQDMDGHPLPRLFEAPFSEERPILLIPSYEASRIAAAGD